ncbi:MAG: tetratricopeptide repeat protein [candidate division KSB1 bacterium]|nr:tetratricopeptide repeat protein [candidate division KSB1 bacterium]MDZ7301799.1 tetratricopeptide repeat protein [candidate division KSB1 bacterium]MDZ7311422.1 tetratricopeptide repeat protein [candidate division KSB1 bacterium]
MPCTNPEIGKLIFMYELKLLSDEERERFEDHLLACEHCFDELWRFSPVISGMEEHRAQILATLEPAVQEDFQIRRRPVIEKIRDLIASLQPFLRPAPIGFALATTVAIFIALLFLFPRVNYAPLAEVTREPYTLFQIMGTSDSLDSAQLFSQGMSYYRNGEDSAAVRLLQQAHRLNPTNAATLFYLGVSYLQLGQFDSASTAFSKGLALKDSLYEERFLWYDGNARLAKNDEAGALQRFEAVKTRAAKYAARAETKIRQIRQAQKDHALRYFFQKIREEF